VLAQLVTSNGRFIAKRFFRLGDETDTEQNVSIEDNNVQIQAELGRLALGQWFLAAFFKDAREKGVMVDEGIFSSFMIFARLTHFTDQISCSLTPS
jgi:hypothetical protein